MKSLNSFAEPAKKEQTKSMNRSIATARRKEATPQLWMLQRRVVPASQQAAPSQNKSTRAQPQNGRGAQLLPCASRNAARTDGVHQKVRRRKRHNAVAVPSVDHGANDRGDRAPGMRQGRKAGGKTAVHTRRHRNCKLPQNEADVESTSTRNDASLSTNARAARRAST